jgi:hypothetical protein
VVIAVDLLCVFTLILTPLAKRKRGASASWAPRVAGVRGHGRKSTKAVADCLLVDVEAGALDKLPLLIKQFIKDGHYSPSIGIEELEWQIMLQQFIASGVVVKNEVINVDSD